VDRRNKRHFSFTEWQPHQCPISRIPSTRQEAALYPAGSGAALATLFAVAAPSISLRFSEV
jgi:hypothetical protein